MASTGIQSGSGSQLELVNQPSSRRQSSNESQSSGSEMSVTGSVIGKCVFTPPEFIYALSELKQHFKSMVIEVATGTEQEEARKAWFHFRSTLKNDLLDLDTSLVDIKIKKGAIDLVVNCDKISRLDPFSKVQYVLVTYGQYIVDNYMLNAENKKKVRLTILKMQKFINDFESKYETNSL